MAMKQPVHPGKIVGFALEDLELSVVDAAAHLGVTRQTLSRLINGKTGLSLEMAVRVSKALGSTPEHWYRMQMAFDMAAMREQICHIHVQPFSELPGAGA